MTVPFHFALVVGSDGLGPHPGRAVGRQEGGQELAAASFKEYGLQDANTLEATQTSIESRAVEEFLLCDQEILLRHLHKETASWIDEYQRKTAGG